MSRELEIKPYKSKEYIRKSSARYRRSEYGKSYYAVHRRTDRYKAQTTVHDFKKLGVKIDLEEVQKLRAITHCEICGTEFSKSDHSRRAIIDHDHKTLKIRGVVCFLCNIGLLPGLERGLGEVGLEYLRRYSQ